jgi:hypothetical protein
MGVNRWPGDGLGKVDVAAREGTVDGRRGPGQVSKRQKKRVGGVETGAAVPVLK